MRAIGPDRAWLLCAAATLLGLATACTKDDERSPPRPFLCGNNLIEGAEHCDGRDLAGRLCSDFQAPGGAAFVGGVLDCASDCASFDTRRCVDAWTCGDDHADPGEACDGEDLRGEGCASLLGGSGLLDCASDCLAYDTRGCRWCGNGVVEPGETLASCCLDVPCPAGVCDPAHMACVDPWLLDCAPGSSGCAASQPWYCVGSFMPTYNCGACGCGGDAVCAEQICYNPQVLERERSGSFMLPRDLPLAQYFALLAEGMGPATLTYAQLASRLDRLLDEDRRRVTLLLGESHGSSDEQDVGLQLVADLKAAGWGFTSLGLESHGGADLLDAAQLAELGLSVSRIQGDLTNVAYCAAAEAGSRNRGNDSGLYLQYTGSGHTSQEVAWHVQHWPICTFPHSAECVTRVSRKALTVILFDPDVWLTMTDQALLWGMEDAFTDEAAFGAALAGRIAAWEEALGAQVQEPAYDALARGRTVNVRAIASPRTPDVFIAYFPRPDRPPWLMKGYAVLWDEPAVRAFLLAHGLSPQRCSISWNLQPGAETLWFWCSYLSAELEAQVDASSWALVDWTHTP